MVKYIGFYVHHWSYYLWSPVKIVNYVIKSKHFLEKMKVNPPEFP